MQHIGAVRRKHPTADRPRDDVGHIEDPKPGKRSRSRCCQRSTAVRRVNRRDLHQWQRLKRPALRVLVPVVERTHQCRAASRRLDRILDPGSGTVTHRPGDSASVVGNTQPFQDRRAMVRVVRVQADPSVIARPIVAGQRRPQVSARYAVDAQEPLAAEGPRGGTEVDSHWPRRAAPITPQDSARQGCRGDGRSRC